MKTPVISLGAGVQSSALLLMSARGELDEHLSAGRPQLAVFADTGWEPRSVYDWLEFLKGEAERFDIEIVTVSAGDIRETLVNPRLSKRSGQTYMKSPAPFYTVEPARNGQLPRHCTRDFKVDPVRRELRRRGFNAARPVAQYMGISIDEWQRMKPSRIEWIDNQYPLVDAEISRDDCLEWMKAQGYPQPPRSACVGCPFHSDAEWLRMRNEEPEAFADAVQFERDLQAADFSALTGKPFLHRSRVPLSEVVLDPSDAGQLAFGDECEGMCGV